MRQVKIKYKRKRELSPFKLKKLKLKIQLVRILLSQNMNNLGKKLLLLLCFRSVPETDYDNIVQQKFHHNRG